MKEQDEIKRRAGITESASEVKQFDVQVKLGGVHMWTRVFAEDVEKANRIAKKLYGTVVGRPKKKR